IEKIKTAMQAALRSLDAAMPRLRDKVRLLPHRKKPISLTPLSAEMIKFGSGKYHSRELFPADVSRSEKHQPGADNTSRNARHVQCREYGKRTDVYGTRGECCLR